ncbi:MAG: hypothetical protein V3T37_03085 [Syntrophobacteria bacterium]
MGAREKNYSLWMVFFSYMGMTHLARIFHESLAATTDMVVLPGVLVCWSLRRTIQVRLETNPAVPRDGCQVAHPSSSRSLRSAQSRKRVPSFVVSRQQFTKYPG